MSNTIWTMKHYDLDGDGITANDMNATPSSSNVIKHASGRTLNFVLNGIDTLEFDLILDDPMALTMNRLSSVVKVWRTVTDNSGTPLYEDAADEPCFAGVVGATIKDGEAKTMKVICYSPLWRLQFRFHLLNHYLKTNPDTSDPWKQSELMWKLIDLINEAFGVASNTGIDKGTFAWAGEPEISPFFVQKGSNTWSNIFLNIMARPAGVDIIPRYSHTDGNPRLMYLDTDEKRGQDTSATTSFKYHTGTNDNLENLTEEIQVIPEEFANYLWAVGQGGPNSGKIAMRQNNSAVAGSDGYGEIGVYMRRYDVQDVKLYSALGPIAQAEFDQSKKPKNAYQATMSPAVDFYYGSDFVLGNVVRLDANKGALVVTNQKKRIFTCTLAQSDLNVETASPLIADDFYGKIA